MATSFVALESSCCLTPISRFTILQTQIPPEWTSTFFAIVQTFGEQGEHGTHCVQQPVIHTCLRQRQRDNACEWIGKGHRAWRPLDARCTQPNVRTFRDDRAICGLSQHTSPANPPKKGAFHVCLRLVKAIAWRAPRCAGAWHWWGFRHPLRAPGKQSNGDG